jgi:hypothetical protein
LIRDSYRGLTSEFVTQLHHMDSALSTLIRDSVRPTDSLLRPDPGGVP